MKTTGTSRETTLQQPFVSRSYGAAPQHAFGWWIRSVCNRSVFGGPEKLLVSVSAKRSGLSLQLSTSECRKRKCSIQMRSRPRPGPWKPLKHSIFFKSQTTIFCQPLARKFQERSSVINSSRLIFDIENLDRSTRARQTGLIRNDWIVAYYIYFINFDFLASERWIKFVSIPAIELAQITWSILTVSPPRLFIRVPTSAMIVWSPVFFFCYFCVWKTELSRAHTNHYSEVFQTMLKGRFKSVF